MYAFTRSRVKSAIPLLLISILLAPSAIVVLGEELVEPVKTFTVPWLPDPSVNNITVTLIPVGRTVYEFLPTAPIAVDRGSNTIAVAWAQTEVNNTTYIHYIYLTLFRFYDVDGDGRLDTYNNITRYIGCAYLYPESMSPLGVVAGNGTVLVYWQDGDGFDFAVVDENGTVLLYEDPTPGVAILPPSVEQTLVLVVLTYYVPWINNGMGGFLVTSFNLTGVRYYLIYYNASEGRWRIDYWSDVWEVPDPSNQSIDWIIPIVGEEKILLAIRYRDVVNDIDYQDVVFTDDRGVIGRPNITIGNGILIYYGRHVNIGNNSYFVLVGINTTSGEFTVFVIDEYTGATTSLTLDSDFIYSVVDGKDGFILLTEYGRLIKLSIDGGQLYKVNETSLESEGICLSPYYDYVSEDTSGVLMIPYTEPCDEYSLGRNVGIVLVRDIGDSLEVAYSVNLLSAEDLPEPGNVSQFPFIGALTVDTFAMYVEYEPDNPEDPELPIQTYILVATPGDEEEVVTITTTVTETITITTTVTTTATTTIIQPVVPILVEGEEATTTTATTTTTTTAYMFNTTVVTQTIVIGNQTYTITSWIHKPPHRLAEQLYNMPTHVKTESMLLITSLAIILAIFLFRKK